MHELSVAHSLVDVVMEHLIESGGTRVRSVVVEVGDLSGIVPTALQSAFKVASDAEPSLRGAGLDIRPVGVAIYCKTCGVERQAVSVQSLRCVTCGQASADVVRGRELEVIGIEVDDAATHA